MLSKKDILECLENGTFSFPPLTFSLIQKEPVIVGNYRPDALVEVSWKKTKAKFFAECRTISTPKIFRNALLQLKSLMASSNYLPMLIVPFLNEMQLRELEREGISGVDLCGNGVVIAPQRFSVFRSGGKNRFPSSALIKNIYRKNTSMVSRAFFTRSTFRTVQEICDEVNRRNLLVIRAGNKPMSLSTVSKALKTLEDDLIIERTNTIRLLQPDKLLEKLNENFSPIEPNKKILLKCAEAKESVVQMLGRLSGETGLPLVATGISSVSQFAVMQRSDMLSVYCPRIEKIVGMMPCSQSDRFPNLELTETKDETVYFDAREQQNFWWASPVQVYLELMSGDKRDQETAEQVKSLILKNLQ